MNNINRLILKKSLNEEEIEEIVDYINFGSDMLKSIVYAACFQGNIFIMTLLLDKCNLQMSFDYLVVSCRNKNDVLFNYLIKKVKCMFKYQLRICLREICKFGCLSMLEDLLVFNDLKYDFFTENIDFVKCAINYGNVEIAEKILLFLSVEKKNECFRDVNELMKGYNNNTMYLIAKFAGSNKFSLAQKYAIS